MKTILKKFAAFLCAALVLCACSDDDYSEAHQTLMALIRQAESLVEESTEGIEEGDTAPGSKKALQARIDQAYYIMHNTSRDEGYRNACKQLEEAIKAFRENIVKAGIPYFNAGSKMNLGPAGDWDLTEELTWEMKIRFDEFAAGDQNVISCEQGKGAIMIRNNGANLQFYVNDGSWKGGTCCTIELNKWYHITATYKANDKMHFYLDGRLVKSFACGKAIVEIHGKACPVLGRVCMDQMMVDVTDVPEVREDDEAILWGGTVSDTAETIARKTDTIPYEVLCGVSRRVPRVYRDHGQIVAVEDWILEA